MKKQSLFLTLLGILMVQLVFAQQKTITGNITDESGLPLPGASIIIENTTRRVATDFDGKYSITASEGDVLVFSFVGFISQRITVGASDVINVNFQDDSSELQEVIVTAYGTQKRESIAGAVSVIKSDQIENATFSNPVKSLEGLVSGLRVIQANGQPGSDPIIRIRGFGSINADNSPLIVLDGVPYSGSLSSINPQDIESTSVLKDASWTKLREISLKYSLPDSFLNQIGLKSSEIGISGRNLLLISNFDGVDPEVNLTGASKGRGLDYFSNPGTKSFIVNLKLNF